MAFAGGQLRTGVNRSHGSRPKSISKNTVNCSGQAVTVIQSGKSIRECSSGFAILPSQALHGAGLIIDNIMVISFGGLKYAWNSSQVISLFAISFLLQSSARS
jgi:hypothetical protein